MEIIEQPFNNRRRDLKKALLMRFLLAREKLGRNWRKKMAAEYPFYDTHQGGLIMTSARDAVGDVRYISIEKLEPLVVAMEVLAKKTTTKKLKS